MKEEGFYVSFVSLIATNEFISFMSDGRATDTERNVIVDENLKKIKKINNSIIFSVTGNAGAGKILFENYHSYDNTNAKKFAENIFNDVAKGATDKDFYVLIGGLDASNNLFFTGFDSQKTMHLDFIYPLNGDVRFGTSGNLGNIDSDIIREIKKTVAKHNRFNVLDAKAIQDKINLAVAKVDTTVNTRTFHDALLKPFYNM